MHAISSAGVVFAVTRACSSGQLDRCGCDRSVSAARSPPAAAGTKQRRRTGGTAAANSFQWSGCSDNIAYGVAFAKSFVDAGERTGLNRSTLPDRAVVNLHNNNAGRKASTCRQASASPSVYINVSRNGLICIVRLETRHWRSHQPLSATFFFCSREL